MSIPTVAVPRAQLEAYARALKALARMHRANDLLMAWLIAKDQAFFPSRSPIWPAVVESYEAIQAARAVGIEITVPDSPS